MTRILLYTAQKCQELCLDTQTKEKGEKIDEEEEEQKQKKNEMKQNSEIRKVQENEKDKDKTAERRKEQEKEIQEENKLLREPKRPPSAYFIFAQEMKQALGTDVPKACANLQPDIKNAYQDRAAALMSAYEEEYANYHRR